MADSSEVALDDIADTLKMPELQIQGENAAKLNKMSKKCNKMLATFNIQTYMQKLPGYIKHFTDMANTTAQTLQSHQAIVLKFNEKYAPSGAGVQIEMTLGVQHFLQQLQTRWRVLDDYYKQQCCKLEELVKIREKYNDSKQLKTTDVNLAGMQMDIVSPCLQAEESQKREASRRKTMQRKLVSLEKKANKFLESRGKRRKLSPKKEEPPSKSSRPAQPGEETKEEMIDQEEEEEEVMECGTV